MKVKISKNNVADIIALSDVQEGMLYHHLRDKSKDVYFQQFYIHLAGDIALDIFLKSWERVIKKNDALRVIYRWEGLTNPVQIILKDNKAEICYYEKQKDQDSISFLYSIVEQERTSQFDFLSTPLRIKLLKVDQKEYYILVSYHHIMFDGWSTAIIIKELFDFYDALQSEGNPNSKNKTSLKECMKFHRKSSFSKEFRFWEDYLSGYNSNHLFNKVRPIFFAAGVYEEPFPQKLKEKLTIFSKENKVSVACLIYLSWSLLLCKLYEVEDMLIGTTVSVRPSGIKDIENIIGLFINTIPFRFNYKAGEIVKDLIWRINKSYIYRNEYKNIPANKLSDILNISKAEVLFNSIVVFENYPVANFVNNNIRLLDYSHIPPQEINDEFVVIVTSQLSSISITYPQLLYDYDALVNLSSGFFNILELIITQGDKMIGELEIDKSVITEDSSIILDNTEADFNF